MKSFIGLLKKEHAHYASLNFVMVGFAVFAISIVPVVLHNYYSQSTIQGNRFIFTLVASSIVSFLCIFSFFSSLKADIRKKELWLHNTQSIITLIMAKAVYQLVSVLVINAVCFTGFFFVGDQIDGTLGQLCLFYIYCISIILVLYPTMLILTLFFYAISLELKRYIGKLSVVVSFFLAVVFFSMADEIPSGFFRFGKVPTDWLFVNFPKFNGGIMVTQMDMYVGSEIASFLFLGALFVISCKWIERVITR
ncbi:hypothetical protein ACTHOQ_00095 [Solibacillus silvestris]|uniref:hypothetical protein n=1 Tax=Solibacillus silvestris TaxID=76853 RepID=UPI003F7FD22D